MRTSIRPWLRNLALPVVLLCAAQLPTTLAAAAEVSASADSEVRILIGGRVRISRITDINLGSYGGAGDLSGDGYMCIYHNDGGRYSITPSSAHAQSGQFRVSGTSDFIRYSVNFTDNEGRSFTGITSGQRLTNLQGHSRSPACQGQTNATLTVEFSADDLQAAGGGTYTDVITLLVEPS
ncbi:MAG: hypothetical protein JJT88_02865 [Gammaproteobacteria bacterium]|nr:hypothetical protein [Gammaproteobacteria bacterium]